LFETKFFLIRVANAKDITSTPESPTTLALSNKDFATHYSLQERARIKSESDSLNYGTDIHGISNAK
jgi:hypothetical protein